MDTSEYKKGHLHRNVCEYDLKTTISKVDMNDAHKCAKLPTGNEKEINRA